MSGDKAALGHATDDALSSEMRDRLGQLVRQAWIRYWERRIDAAKIRKEHPTWFLGWIELTEVEREVDREIGVVLWWRGVLDALPREDRV
jgi:hypothetical protein